MAPINIVNGDKKMGRFVRGKDLRAGTIKSPTTLGDIQGGAILADSILSIGDITVVAGNISVDSANGYSVTTSPGGGPTEIQFNDNGTLAGNAALTWDPTFGVTSSYGFSTSADVSANNVSVTTDVSTYTVTATGNVSGANLVTTGIVDATGNVSGGNLVTAGIVDATGNVSGGNLTTAGAVVGDTLSTGNVSITDTDITVSLGNITTGNVTINNTDITLTTGNLATGNVTIADSTVTATGNIEGGNVYVGTGNVDGGNINFTSLLFGSGNVLAGNINSYASGNVFGGNVVTGNVTIADATVTAVGNVSGGNLTTAGQVTATGNVTGGNLITGAQVVATGNVTGGNLVTSADVTTATVTASGNISTGGILFIDTGSQEKFSSLSSATGTVTHDCSNGHIFYHTSPSADFTANFTNLNLGNTYATTTTLVVIQGGTARIANAVQIGGSAQTINWQGGSEPTGTNNGIDVITFSILNNGGTYTVLGQLVDF